MLKNENNLISLKEASKLSGYSCDYVGQLCRAKRVKGKKIGRNWFVDIKNLISYRKEEALKSKESIYSPKFVASRFDIKKYIKYFGHSFVALMIVIGLVFSIVQISGNIKNLFSDKVGVISGFVSSNVVASINEVQKDNETRQIKNSIDPKFKKIKDGNNFYILTPIQK